MTDRSDQAQPQVPSPYQTAFRLDLEQQRRRAKEWQKAFLAGDAGRIAGSANIIRRSGTTATSPGSN